MKKYSEIPKTITADQWDGTKAKMKALQTDFKLSHNDVDYNEDGGVKRWVTKPTANGVPQLIQSSDFLILDHLNTFKVMPEAEFKATYK